MNATRIYRLDRDEGLEVRTKVRKKFASQGCVPLPPATRPNERWRMDFASARLADGRWFPTLTVLDLYTRECGNAAPRRRALLWTTGRVKPAPNRTSSADRCR